jgi:hypothetical protein
MYCKLCLVKPHWLQEVVNSYTTDVRAQQLLKVLAMTSPNQAEYSLDNGLIRYRSQLWIGTNLALQTKLIATFHSSAIGALGGIPALKSLIKGSETTLHGRA